IEAVITGVLDPHINGSRYWIELYDVQDNKVIHQFKGIWSKKDDIIARDIQSPDSTGTSRSTWTPPVPSDYDEISQYFLNSHEHATLADVGNALQTALKNAGFKTTYLAVPEGFALVSNDVDFKLFFDGTPISPNATIFSKTLYLLNAIKKNPLTIPEVWISGLSKQTLDSSEQIFHKVICVIVTPGDPWGQDQMTFKQAQNLITSGGATIPDALKNQKYEEKHKGWALLYAFEKDPSGDGNKIRFVSLRDKRINIHDHLKKTGFWDNP
ncbi:MAG: hypothetical protein D3908_00405, partial [Candidatus Electrothrix sp. AUS4]|nr:hypothetical protein [Candidatus Electrothrix sp. AUS4]